MARIVEEMLVFSACEEQRGKMVRHQGDKSQQFAALVRKESTPYRANQMGGFLRTVEEFTDESRDELPY